MKFCLYATSVLAILIAAVFTWGPLLAGQTVELVPLISNAAAIVILAVTIIVMHREERACEQMRLLAQATADLQQP